MAVGTLFPTHGTVLTNGYELIIEPAADYCLHIKGDTPTVGNTLLHAQSLLGVPCTKDIGIAYKVEMFALAQAAYVE